MNECTILKILTSVKKFFSFMLTPRNQKSIELLKVNSCFCEDVYNTRTWRVFAEQVTYVNYLKIYQYNSANSPCT